MPSIDLNCDMGEGAGNEALLMPYISSANIACGFHAGDKDEMKRVIDLCLEHGVAIGAHPGFRDKTNFGRMEMDLSSPEIHHIITDQLEAINEIVNRQGGKLYHVKAHGALYNMAARQIDLARTISKAVKAFNPSLICYGLSGSVMISAAAAEGLKTASEVFADRTYQPDGSLTPRMQANALIEDEITAILQTMQMIKNRTVTAVDGKQVAINAETICIHGDGKQAVTFAKLLRNSLQEEGISIKKID